MFRFVVGIAVVCTLLGTFHATAGGLDDELDGTLRGAWAVLAHDVYSSCSGTYSDNRVGAAGVSSKASRRFEAGELVKIDKIKVKRSRVDLLTTLSEPVLVATQDGPFELYNERECKAQLIFEVPREVIKTRDADAVLAAIGSALTLYSSQSAAMDAADWNGRERKPFPDDYEQTLARYERWKAEQTNAAVAAAIEKATSESAEVAEDIERDADYLDGFAAGAEKQQSLTIDDCARLIDATFSSFKDRPPSDKSADAKWKSGFTDGQSLVFHLYLLDELRHCFVPVPPPLP
jgi:hypothetical protein